MSRNKYGNKISSNQINSEKIKRQGEWHNSRKNTDKWVQMNKKFKYPENAEFTVPFRPHFNFSNSKHRLIFLLLFLFALRGVNARSSSSSSSYQKYETEKIKIPDLKKLVDSKTIMEAGTYTPADYNEAEKIKSTIIEIIVRNPGNTYSQQLVAVLNEPAFKIKLVDKVCLPLYPEPGIKQDCSFDGKFQPQTSSMYFSLKAGFIPASLITHETRHAFTFFYRIKNPKCRSTSPDKIITPIYPITLEKIKQLNSALDKGDARIKATEKLHQKHFKNPHALNKNQKEELKECIDAAQGCLLSEFYFSLTPEQYEYYRDLCRNNPGKTIELSDDNGKLQLIDLKHLSDKGYVMLVKPATPEMVLFRIPNMVENSLNVGEYYKRSLLAKTFEREAYTLQSLGDKAYQKFYPEANKIYEEFIEACKSSEEETFTSTEQKNSKLEL